MPAFRPTADCINLTTAEYFSVRENVVKENIVA